MSETFLILRISQRGTITNVRSSSCKVAVIPVRYSRQIPKNIQVTNFIKIRPVGAELFHADGQTDRHDEANSRF
jgi:hypothetical protein